MQSLLRWSIENSTPLDSAPSDRPPIERKNIDPAIIEMILGKPESELMKEDISVAVDANRNEDDRINALDHFEMLIEQIDNANNLEKLKLWEPLHSLLTSESSTLEIKIQVLWVIGTALQNNPSAQDAYLSFNPLPTLLSFLDPSPSSSVSIRAKAIYTLSGLLKHNSPAVEALELPETDGWSKLRVALQDPAISVRRKTIFLFNSLLIPTSSTKPQATDPSSTNILTPDTRPTELIHPNSHAAHLQDPSRTSTSELTLNAFRQYHLVEATISALTTPLPYGDDGEHTEADVDFEEKCLRSLYIYAVLCQGVLSKTHKSQLKVWIQSQKSKQGGERQMLEKWGIAREEYAAFIGKVL